MSVAFTTFIVGLVTGAVGGAVIAFVFSLPTSEK